MKERLNRVDYYSLMAKLTSLRSTCGRLRVGCVATLDGRVIATGYNGDLPDSPPCQGFCNLSVPCERAVHAERNLIDFCAQNGIRLKGATLYTTHCPCKDCARSIIQSGIKEVVYQEEFRDTLGLNILKESDKVSIRIHKVKEITL